MWVGSSASTANEHLFVLRINHGPQKLPPITTPLRLQVPNGMQNGVSPVSRTSTSPFASTSGDNFASGEQREERPPENGGDGVVPANGVDQDVQTALLPGQKYKGPPNLDPATVSLGATKDSTGQKLSYPGLCFHCPAFCHSMLRWPME